MLVLVGQRRGEKGVCLGHKVVFLLEDGRRGDVRLGRFRSHCSDRPLVLRVLMLFRAAVDDVRVVYGGFCVVVGLAVAVVDAVL